MDNRTESLTKLLAELQSVMQQLELWSVTRPDDAALQSQAPFACDTLRLEQWLQFVFIPTMHNRLAEQQALPGEFAILPAAQVSWPGESMMPLKAVLAKLDAWSQGLNDL